jgi:hypothetical protein
MPLKLFAFFGICAVTTLVFLNLRKNSLPPSRNMKRLPAETRQSDGLTNRSQSPIDRFLFDMSFGWEIGRILFVAMPVVILLIAIWWLLRNKL